MTHLPADEMMRRGSEGVKSGGRLVYLIGDSCGDSRRLCLTDFSDAVSRVSLIDPECRPSGAR